MKINKDSRGNNFIDISSDTHKKIMSIYSTKMLGSKVLYLGLVLIITVATIALAIVYIPKAEASITNREYVALGGIALAIIIADLATIHEYIIIPMNIKNNKLKCIRGKITDKREFVDVNEKNSDFFKYEVYMDNDIFKLACAKEYRYIDKNTNVNFVYVKSALGKYYLPLLAYLPDEIGLDYEMLNTPDFSYEQFRSNETGKDISDNEVKIKSYHDDLDGAKTKVLIQLEEELTKAPAGSKEQLRIMEKIGAERHKIKRANAKKNRLNKLKEIIAIIKR